MKSLRKKFKKLAVLLCASSSFMSPNMNAVKTAPKSLHVIKSDSQQNGYTILQNFESSMTGYIEKKIDGKDEKILIGKIKLVPISEKHKEDWNRIMDCSNDQGKDYLKWWTSKETLNNDFMDKKFNSLVKLMHNKIPKRLTFMVEFSEFETPVETKNLSKAKLKDPKIAGHISLVYNQSKRKKIFKSFVNSDIKDFISPFGFYEKKFKFYDQGECLLSYVVDKDFQGKGIGTKSLEIATNLGEILYLNGTYPVKNFILYIACDNVGSKRVAEKCDFRDAGPVPKNLTNNLEAHKWERTVKRSKIFNFIKSLPKDSNTRKRFERKFLPCPIEELKSIKQQFINHTMCRRFNKNNIPTNIKKISDWINEPVLENEFEIINFRDWEEKFRSKTFKKIPPEHIEARAVDPIYSSNKARRLNICKKIDELILTSYSENEKKDVPDEKIVNFMALNDFPVAWYHPKTEAIFPIISNDLTKDDIYDIISNVARGA